MEELIQEIHESGVKIIIMNNNNNKKKRYGDIMI